MKISDKDLSRFLGFLVEEGHTIINVKDPFSNNKTIFLVERNKALEICSIQKDLEISDFVKRVRNLPQSEMDKVILKFQKDIIQKYNHSEFPFSKSSKQFHYYEEEEIEEILHLIEKIRENHSYLMPIRDQVEYYFSLSGIQRVFIHRFNEILEETYNK
jgi:hypothetical protein